MDDNYFYLLLVIIIVAFGRDKAGQKQLNRKFAIVNKKLNTLLAAECIEYPKAEHISYKAKMIIKRGDRNKATGLIIKETDCSKDQALALIEKLEKLNMPNR